MRGLLELVYPPACVACARVLPARGFFCEACDAGVERVALGGCPRCGEPQAQAGATCTRCARTAPPFARAWAPLVHEGSVARAVHRFKYEDHPELAPLLAELLASEAQGFLEHAPAAIVSIPLHVRRFRERRYDQAQLLAGALARLTGRTCLSGVLERTRATPRQVGLDDEARAANVADAFRAWKAPRSVLLVDDVYTTGATARAATHALLDAGAAEVEVLALARAYHGA